ncbi:MAG: OmpA family protein, partial [Candidatus Omnitrophica bacterium]|nr:OmpA family protein [Candidatus Omnitrophota bacterium]
LFFVLFLTVISLAVSGCSITFQTRHKSDVDKISSLGSEIDDLNARLSQLQEEKEAELSNLEKAKLLLEEKLKQEIGDESVRLEMAEKGLAIIFLTEVLFDSGKAEIKSEAFSSLDKVAGVLEQNVEDRNIGIEGHTDNEPIKRSGWKSNWELSTSRATSVLHYLVDKKGISPKRVAAIGYGEYRPVASNDTAAGKKQNRRVEIVILPKNMEKIQADMDKITQRKQQIERQIKKYKK